MDARRFVWEGQIPINLRLHQSEVTTMPPPLPLLLMAPRNSYLPLLADVIRPHFQSVLPPGEETLWFDFNGLPLKWHIPTGVLFDLLCLEPERPWNLTVHFRAFPSEVLNPYEGITAAQWNYMNALKEASYILHGSTKSVMNLTQADQKELWKSITTGDMEAYDRVAVRLAPKAEVPVDTAKVPLRIYVRSVKGSSDDPFSVPPIGSWDEVVTMTRPIELPVQEDQVMTLGDALVKVMPQLFRRAEQGSVDEYRSGVQFGGLVRIQGIQPSLDLPLQWIAKNLSCQEHFTHICVWIFQLRVQRAALGDAAKVLGSPNSCFRSTFKSVPRRQETLLLIQVDPSSSNG